MATLVGGPLAPVPLTGGSGPFRYPHALVLIKGKQLVTGGVAQTDDYNQPVEDTPTEIPFQGLLVERSTSKIQAANAAGRTIGTNFLKAPAALSVTKNDSIRRAADDGRRYEVNGDPRPAGGRLHHLEIDLQLVTP